MWQSGLPVVTKMADWPCLGVAEEGVRVGRGEDGVDGDLDIAGGGVLEADGQETPETSWRWTWLSVVRAPMAPQLTRPAMYCGEIMSRNSVPVGTPILGEIEQEMAREAQAVVDLVGLVEDGDR